MLTSSPKEASTPVSVKTTTKTDAIIEEEDIMPQLLVKEAVPLDRDRKVGRDDNSERPYLTQMVEIKQEENRRLFVLWKNSGRKV